MNRMIEEKIEDYSDDAMLRSGVLRLTDRDRNAFLAALDNPPKPNARLRKSARRHLVLPTAAIRQL